jgi:hypothetical protein
MRLCVVPSAVSISSENGRSSRTVRRSGCASDQATLLQKHPRSQIKKQKPRILLVFKYVCGMDLSRMPNVWDVRLLAKRTKARHTQFNGLKTWFHFKNVRRGILRTLHVQNYCDCLKPSYWKIRRLHSPSAPNGNATPLAGGMVESS